MKPITPHDPLDDLIAASLHGDLTPQEHAQFESRLANDPAAYAAYQEAQAMNDLLEKTHKTAQPDAAFEQRMVSGVRRKIQHEPKRETAWESLVVLGQGLKRVCRTKRRPVMPILGSVFTVLVIISILAGVALGPITNGIKQSKQSAELQAAHGRALADYQAQLDAGVPNPVMKDARQFVTGVGAPSQVTSVFSTITSQLAVAGPSSNVSSAPPTTSPVLVPNLKTRLATLERNEERYRSVVAANPDNKAAADHLARLEKAKQAYDTAGQIAYGQPISQTPSLATVDQTWNETVTSTTPQGGTIRGTPFNPPADGQLPMAKPESDDVSSPVASNATPPPASVVTIVTSSEEKAEQEKGKIFGIPTPAETDNKASSWTQDGQKTSNDTRTPTSITAADDRKLIRNAQLDLEVKSFQGAFDLITTMTKGAGGYVDTSNSQRGGNGKLQGTVVVKILPQNLDVFLLKLRDLGEVKNQSVSTDDVTKDYFDTQARLGNSQKMEVQLQDLLKRENGKVSDLLAVEKELGRVRGEIEQMQGQLKLYDFQVQYATVTMQLAEKDLKQTAAYLLKEQDDFSLFATDVEATFQTARKTADDFKAQVLVANLNHNSGSDVSAQLQVSVPPDEVEGFLTQIRALGRVANFTRNTNRVAQDGGDSAQPADQTMTEKDKVLVNVAIRSDDETRKQVAMMVVTKTVDDALDQAKTAAMAQPGAAIISSSLNKAPEGQSTAQLSVRVPGKSYAAILEAFRALGRTASMSVQRNDDAGPGANGDDAPVIVSLSLTDDDTPLQTTQLAIIGSDIDDQSQQIKKDAASAGVEVKSSSFQQQPDGTEMAQMTFRLPMAKYSAFLASLQKLGKTESLSVQRNDRPDQARTDDGAPAEIDLQLHNQRGIVAENGGLGATLRRTFGEGADALFGSVRVIGVLLAFVLPWIVTLAVLAWIARRIYVWRKRK